MTDATVEHIRENRRGTGSILKCLKLRTAVAEAAAAVKAQPTLNIIGLVAVCTILCDSSGASKRDRFTEKPVAVAEEREGGPVTLDLTQWDFNKADCRTRCRKLIENSKPLLLMGSPIVSGGEDEEQIRAVLHLAFVH